jgi:hypothetical protein
MIGLYLSRWLWILMGVGIAFAPEVWAQNTDVPPPLANAPAAPAPPPPPAAAAEPSLSPVILTEDASVVQRFSVNPDAVRQMVNSSLLKLTSANDLATAWTRLGITPADTVGIKITTMGGPALSSHRPIVQAICDGLQAAGVSSSHIIIWDKYAEDMRSAGYAPVSADNEHVRIAAVFPGTGYDPTNVYKNGILGTLIWGDYEFIRNDADANDDIIVSARDAVNKDKIFANPSGSDASDSLLTGSSIPQTSDRSYYAWLVTQSCTKIINVPVLTDNSYIGLNGCLGSLALACIDNNRRFQGDPTYGDPAICEILDKDFIRRKVVVHILDALIAEYAGGPRFDPQFTQSIGAIYMSRDPVAIDSLVLKRIEKWRKQGGIDAIGKMAGHVHSAALFNLGTDDPRRIQLVRMQ